MQCRPPPTTVAVCLFVCLRIRRLGGRRQRQMKGPRSGPGGSVLLLLVLLFFGVALLFPGGHGQMTRQDYDNEEVLLSFPNPDTAMSHLKYLSSLPRVAGSVYDEQSALYVKSKFEEYGFQAEMVPFQAHLTYPKEMFVHVLSPISWTASVREDSVAEDPSSNDTRVIPTYNAYTPNAEVTGSVVYCNYGREEDYNVLKQHGVVFRGAIVLVRYGKISRMAKALLAQLEEAAGLLLYSDPGSNGFGKGAEYPDGPWAPPSGVQMGSVMFSSVCPGDPSYARMALGGPCINENSPLETLLPDIPVHPLSWKDAYPILSNLKGDQVPESWRGGLNITYRFGRIEYNDSVQVLVHTVSDFTTATVWNVFGTLRGTVEPNNVVLLGNHRDSWAFGAVDAASGTAVMLEVARSISSLMNSIDWRPRRTLILCSWDAEEFAFIGSTFYAENSSSELLPNAVAYLNVDLGVAGPDLYAYATPSFTTFIQNATKRVPLPDGSGTVFSAWTGIVETLGSGSDFVPFLDHLGIASIDITFNSSMYNGVYHSVYDSLNWVKKFAPIPYFKTSAQLLGLLTYRLISDILLPFNYTDYANALTNYVAQTELLIKENGGAAEVDLQPIRLAIADFQNTAAFLESERAKIVQLLTNTGTRPLSDALKASITHYNERAKLAERNFTTTTGLENQGRPWYKHVVQAPGLYDGYNPDVLPGLTQAAREQNWPLAIQEASRIAHCIKAASAFLLDAPPVVDEYAGPIAAIKLASVMWGCVCFLLLLGLVAFFVWRYIKTSRPLAEEEQMQTMKNNYEYDFLRKSDSI